MTLRHFRIFQAVCAAQSITGAAEALNMTQPAVSLAVRELESFYRTQLFERMNRRIYLTEDGKLLLQYAGTVLSQYEESIRAIRESSESPVCRIGVNVTVGETRLAEMAGQIRRAEPSIRLRLFVGNAEMVARRLAENEIDLAIADSPSQPPNCRSRAVFAGQMAAVCSPALGLPDALTAGQFAQQPLLLREKGSASRALVDGYLARGGFSCEPAAESVSSLALLRLAESGFGVSVLPLELADESLRAGRLRRVEAEGADFSRSFYLLCHRSKYLTAAMRAAAAQLTGGTL